MCLRATKGLEDVKSTVGEESADVNVWVRMNAWEWLTRYMQRVLEEDAELGAERTGGLWLAASFTSMHATDPSI